MKRLITFLIVLLLFLQSTTCVFAANGNVIYSGKAEKFIFEPGSKYSPTDLFVSFKDVMPGDSISQKITVKNAVKNKTNIKVYLRSLGAHEDSEEFLAQMKLRVEAQNNTELFDAKADETAQLTEWTYLGTLYSGGEVDLEVILDVPVTMDNRFSDQVGYLDWEFMIEEFPIGDSDPVAPSDKNPWIPQLPLGTGGTKTGDSAQIALWAGCLVAAGIGIILIRKRDKED